MVKVYVAGKFADGLRIRKHIQRLAALGLEITRDWTVVEVSPSNPELRLKYAKLDIDAVKNADLLIVDMMDPSYPYRGTWTEIGAALGANKRVYIVSKHGSTNLFYHHPSVIPIENWDDMYKLVQVWNI